MLLPEGKDLQGSTTSLNSGENRTCNDGRDKYKTDRALVAYVSARVRPYRQYAVKLQAMRRPCQRSRILMASGYMRIPCEGAMDLFISRRILVIDIFFPGKNGTVTLIKGHAVWAVV